MTFFTIVKYKDQRIKMEDLYHLIYCLQIISVKEKNRITSSTLKITDEM